MQIIGDHDRVEVFLFGLEVLHRGLLGGGLRGCDVGLELVDEALDASDLAGLGCFVALGALNVIPRGVGRSERGGNHGSADRTGGDQTERTSAE